MYTYDLNGHFKLVLSDKIWSNNQVIAPCECVSTLHTHSSLGIGQSVTVRELVGVLLAEDMAHARAGDDLQRPSAHPHSKGDFCRRGWRGVAYSSAHAYPPPPPPPPPPTHTPTRETGTFRDSLTAIVRRAAPRCDSPQ